MNKFVAYHKSHERGPFSERQYLTNQSHACRGDRLFVGIGDKPKGTSYMLSGEYEICEQPERIQLGDGRSSYRLSLRPLRAFTSPVRLDTDRTVTNDRFRRAYVYGGGPMKLKPEWEEVFERLLDDACASTSTVAEDIEDVLNDESIGDTTKRQWIEARIGQGKFRLGVIDTWGAGEVCAITGIDVREILNASHIVAWKDSKELRLEGTNGLLLCAHLDRLFDRYLISFDDIGRLIVSLRLAPERWATLEKELNVKKGVGLRMDRMNFTDERKVLANLKVHRTRMAKIDSA